jgi:exopolysaccharide production protein ExoQ
VTRPPTPPVPPEPPVHPVLEATYAFFSHGKFARALSVTILATAFGVHLLRATMGWAGLNTLLVTQILLVVMMMLARRRMITWNHVVPISLALFMGWCFLSLVWSAYLEATWTGLAYQIAFAILGLALAATRDTIQLIRSVGDVLRVYLGLSLALEIVSGILIDGPIRFLGISGNLAQAGSIQGIFGGRNPLAVISLVALVTFVVEWRTRSVSRKVSIGSIIGAGALLSFAGSPVGWAGLFFVGVVAAVLYGLRALSPERRRTAQFVVLSVGLLAVIVAWVSRTALITALSAGGVITYRLDLWREMWSLTKQELMNGWGWTGLWRPDTYPFRGIDFMTGSTHRSGLNVILDTWFQVGLVGLVLLLIAVGLAFIRGWQLATNKKSEGYVWAPLVLTVLLATGMTESNLLIEWGWLLAVIIMARTSTELSWRKPKQ